MDDLPILDSIEQRVLGVLLEKEKTTPDYYPLTINGIMTACNQKSSRNPVMTIDEVMVQIGIDGLRKHGLANTVVASGSRTVKYKHNANINLDLEPNEEAAMCLLLLRGPLTSGEIKSNSSRLHDFEDLEAVQSCLKELSEKESPLIQLLPKKTGQKEGRYIHLLGGEINAEDEAETIVTPVSNYEQRLRAAEEEIADIKEKMSKLLDLLD